MANFRKGKQWDGPVITAVYDGTCPLCGDPIVSGMDEITKLDDEWVHLDCI